MKKLLWRSTAPCAGKLDMFFDETHAKSVRAARKICNMCAVHVECLAYALEHQEIGVWAGTTTNQRAKILRQKRKDAKKDSNYTRAV
jgi:WhiB family redox-sensing transcriptional regulator